MTQEGTTILDQLGVDVGFKTTFAKTITETDLTLLAAVSGDYNPVHVNEEYAKKTRYKGIIAPCLPSILCHAFAV